MTFTRYKKFGQQEYAYEITPYWDQKTKKPRQKSRYLGVVVNKEKNIIEKRAQKKETEKLILDFGDSYALHNVFEKTGFIPMLKNVFGERADFLSALLSYRLCYGSAMRYSGMWFSGSYAKMQYKGVNLSSQRISDFLKILSDEKLQRTFFAGYIARFSSAKKGIIIDATSLPNQIHMPLTAWGLNGEEIDKQIRFLLVVDKENSIPLFFRYLPGNIVDVSALQNTVDELQKFGIKESYAYLDAGFFSEDNIKEMYCARMNFLTRLPSIRCIYKELIETETKDLESIPNAVRYGKRLLFVKQKKIDLFGKQAYAHIVLDPERKAREIKNLLLQSIDEKSENEDLEYEFITRGIMILVSSFEIDKKEVVPAYYIRQTAEAMFGFSKDDLNILPLRVHKEETLRGFLFFQFIALIAFIQLKNKLEKDYTVEEILITMRNLKCKVYDDGLIVGEMTKQQRKISEKLGIIVPKRLGV